MGSNLTANSAAVFLKAVLRIKFGGFSTIAADSRVSWGDIAVFDHGRKVFSFRHSPDILGCTEGQIHNSRPL
jgi:hypothetical protein